MDFIPTDDWHLDLMPDKPLRVEDWCGITALDNKAQICAVCVLDSWSFTSCRIHIWIENPLVLKHGYAEEVFDFVFGAGRIKIIGETPSDNEKALKFIKHIGFEEIFRVKDALDHGVDIVVTEFTKDRYENGRRYRKRRKKADGRRQRSSGVRGDRTGQ